MGNKAVLCLRDNDEQGFSEDAIGIYLHRDGSESSIIDFLRLARERMGSRLGDVEYAKARLIGVIHDEIDGNLSLGIGIVKELEYYSDNGTYIIDCKTLTISGRAYN